MVHNAETKLLAVIGHPIGHSLSPCLQNRMIELSGLPYVYLAFDVQAGRAADFMRAAKLLDMAGFNVTMPLKAEIPPLLDRLDDTARLCGAVNTVVCRGGAAVGYNTDGEGFLDSVSWYTQRQKAPSALILGCGGAARAIAAAWTTHGYEATAAVRRFAAAEPGPPGVSLINWCDIPQTAPRCTLLVNATPLGMAGTRDDFNDLSFLDRLPSGALVCDLVYRPAETTLLRAARARGLLTQNGLPMLLCQAKRAFTLFTGASAPPIDCILPP